MVVSKLSKNINYVEKIRESEIILGSKIKQINDFEHHKY